MARGAEEPIPLAELDGRTKAAKALAELRRDLIAELGGPEVVTTQQALLVDLVVTSQLIVGSLDAHLTAWIVAGGDPTDTDKNGRLSLAPLMRERAYIADRLAAQLAMLGLERREVKPKDLGAHLAEKYAAPRDAEAQDEPEDVVDPEPSTED